ncbi:MAG: DUF4827 domain-containing protein [Muribaculaceae bacterium]|nr:DUF4827 domain-containing protein [Muribaculaceae bacterium]
MNIFKHISKAVIFSAIAVLSLSSCSDTKSYAERLVDENKAINLYLSDYKVENQIPEDNNFLVGEDAPFYRLDEEGNVFMQVLRTGDRENNMATDDQLIFFRFTRYNLLYYYNYGEMIGEGNALDMNNVPTSFRFNNTTLSSSTQWGSGIQMPLNYLGIDCEVNLIVKSQYGLTSEISTVSPYLYNLRYFKPLSN